ncbi:hypothetical protein DYB35_007554 [Aphanomyces astaci]|uniref:Uncharacterized protein n=1 Tax=Aphanomyces astaci TaxID=112090 RepID=A0A3R7AAS0_APHAT|nr:hypothetical protein DYB35_007554 [Aphanomyces astaci]
MKPPIHTTTVATFLPHFTTASMEATSVLLSTDVLLRITSFQVGVYHDMVPLLHATRKCHDDDDHLPSFHVTFAKWLELHTVERVPLLLATVPLMQSLVAVFAATAGHIALLQDTMSLRSKCRSHENSTSHLVNVAAQAGQVNVIAFLLSGRDDTAVSHEAMVGAATNGHLNVVQYLHQLRPRDDYTTHVLDVAASQGHLDIVTFLHHHRREGCTTAAMDGAAGNGHLSVVKFLHAHRSEGCTKSAISLAAAHGHLDVIVWLCRHRKEGWHPEALTHAAAGGHVDVLAFLLRRRPRAGCLMLGMDLAATNGHLNVVTFLHTHRKDGCTEKAVAGAVRNGHADVVAYFEQHGDDLVHGVCCACGFNKPRRHACIVKSSQR